MYQYQMRNLLLASLVVAPVLFAAGCGSSKAEIGDSPEPGMPGTRDALTGMIELLKYVKHEGLPPPSSKGDFAKYDPIFPAVGTLVQNGTVVYLYGAQIDPSSPEEKLVAMQADAEQNGGLVLVSTGEVKYLEAAEVASLPPGGKKSK
ncbi:hypothetical protein LOC68_16340 [Blastopirellula sp. JC732]|uniref:Uncharacterized protein n=1 Tax=Blastopirellula sediminis TaxID=2894196 RepID=A0A9X1MQ47_9BACT|nr:hypothetical protein [Blastopirellula sediminis]MCC9606741.1 hypothetical protein [Blastopirellula sediminis]MCC9629962.1 hypothetical protein [Blastopirellula sediminis]